MVRKAGRSPLIPTAIRSDGAMPSEVFEWNCPDVAIWLRNMGLGQYADVFADEHKAGDIKRISKAIDVLKKSNLITPQSSPRMSESQDDVLLCVEYNQRRKMSISGEDVYVTTKQSAFITDEDMVDTISSSGDIQSVRLISRDEVNITHVSSYPQFFSVIFHQCGLFL
uniref:SAM domain-containing protein n=1 Tax=Heterorhabditis bacteriophora TaxID=37862 RepID=A0A1I7XFP0_HETBA